jgi:glycosyltransferase involved in cell wall biosynthesis
LLAGIPVLTTTVGEPKYYLQNNVSGYIVEPCCQEALRDKIVEAFSDEDKRLKIAKTGKEVAEKQFDCILQGKNLALYLTGKNEDIAY